MQEKSCTCTKFIFILFCPPVPHSDNDGLLSEEEDDDDDDDDEPSEYEKLRLRNIAELQALIRESGVLAEIQSLNQELRGRPQTCKSITAAASAAARNKKSSHHDDDDEDRSFSPTPPPHRSKRKREEEKDEPITGSCRKVGSLRPRPPPTSLPVRRTLRPRLKRVSYNEDDELPNMDDFMCKFYGIAIE